MSTCPSTVSSISSTFSTVSIISWIFAQLPQILKNYTNKSSEGISPVFLMLWFMGDFLSFTSCLINLDTVLKFQLYISVFFLCNDVTLCFQYYHYNYVSPRHTYVEISDREGGDRSGVDEELPKTPFDTDDVALHQGQDIHRVSHAQNMDQSVSEDYITSTPSSYDSINEEGGRGITAASSSGGGVIKKSIAGTMLQAGRAVALPISANAITASSSKDSLGLSLAWGGTIVYCLSRTPQLYKNYKRKSVDGISPLLFGAALLGNLAYTLSILLSCEFYQGGQERHDFMIKELPYILGSSGTIVFDVAYFVQMYMYRDNARPTSTRNANVMVMESWNDIESRHSNRS
ncbi:putative vacuolar amino acid transporter YPQ2 [Candida viswanathii]|uniref:Putative vacuolar amino acid transporter YPQ2 n=1 Tax=Candida viswanathii TaxID=5486 RepID=A0A367YFI5_9ASCO|nr:putative vacuolar amino acid transporter YPQ2 [Candida viswanathii]